MKILLIGAGGFIGSAIAMSVSKLSHLTLVTVSRKKTTILNSANTISHVIGDFTEYKEWPSLIDGIDVIIHTASRAHILEETSANPISEYRKTNVDLTLHLAECAARSKVSRFIYISSIGVSGLYVNDHAIDEKTPYNPAAPYAVSKMEAEIGLKDICQNSRLEYTIIRPPLVYAEDAPGNFGKLLDMTYRQIPLPLASVLNRRSFISKSNLVEVILACIKSPNAGNEVFSVSDGEDFSTSDLIRLLAKGMGKHARLFPVPDPLLALIFKLFKRQTQYYQLCNSLYIDNSKSIRLLGGLATLSASEQLILAGENYHKLKISTK